jgi:hypothetical protein|tara:strand:+ start:673 stop:858 length:186 start_codon:yes stop_codon:yes gene_type:complete
MMVQQVVVMLVLVLEILVTQVPDLLLWLILDQAVVALVDLVREMVVLVDLVSFLLLIPLDK